MSSLTFLAPLTLLGLLALPLIWWILRIAPPAPKVQSFPPLQLFEDIQTDEETPAKTPIWLLIFRILTVALIIFSLAAPVLKQDVSETMKSRLLVIDDTWLSAPFWSDIIDEAENQIKTARRENVDIAVFLLSDDAKNIELSPAQVALDQIETLLPKPWITAFESFEDTLSNIDFSETETVFLSSGLNTNARQIMMQAFPNLSVFTPVGTHEVILPDTTQEVSDGFETTWFRPISSLTPRDEIVLAFAADNSVLARADLTFGPNDERATARFVLPAQSRNRITHIKLSGSNSTGTVKLLDDSWGRPLIGLLNGTGDTTSPLLSEPFYTSSALEPYADIYAGNLDALINVNPSLIVMSDSQRVEDGALLEYVETGGVLVRFAGEKLASRPDDLLPVTLRTGGRVIGGALSWEAPQSLLEFEPNSPFFGLDISDEITVSRQVMAEPGIETDNKTWARLEDGSPVVTAAPKGDGMIVLFHVTAGPEWSNLALSGLYVEMLRRILPLAKSQSRQDETSGGGEWVANRVLDGFGQFQMPDALVENISDTAFEEAQAASKTPPGFYKQGARTRSLQALSDPESIIALELPGNAERRQYGGTGLQNLAGIGLTLGLLGLTLDAFLALFLSGRMPRVFQQKNHILASLIVVSCFVVSSPYSPAQAQETAPVQKELEAATGLHFAYIETGNGRVDRLTETGLKSLGKQLDIRTTIDVAGVHGVNPETDKLSLYPFLYWVVSRDTSAPTEKAVIELNAYMQSGGTIIFDTRDAADQAITGNEPHPGLARITQVIDIPQLKQIPTDHVLTKSFYLIQSFPGRWANGQVWVDAASNTAGRDGVSPVIIGGHDWAAAWALDEQNRPLIDIDESLPRQREFAVRFGVNLAMYALSGNYKADQVHTAELVKRLGQNNLTLPPSEQIGGDDIDGDDNE